jgi:RHH-type transcriptional regulator, rel operon repressor / antitoxin RelB
MASLMIRIDRKTKTQLEKLAREMDRSEAEVASEALRSYVEVAARRVSEVKAALGEADAGDFADDADVSATLTKWRRGAR